MSKQTAATKALIENGVTFTLHSYDYDPNADRIGLQAAQALGAPAAIVLKTLMAWVDDRAVCAIIPSDRQLQLKRLAAACGGKAARMMEVPEAERRSGYKVGGISPFAQQRPVPAWIERDALDETSVYINAGQRGLLLELAPAAAQAVLRAGAASISE